MIGLHVIPIGLEGRTDELLGHARRMDGACHKFLDPLADRTLFAALYDATPASEWVLRNHSRSEDKTAMKAYGAFGEKKLYGKVVEGVIRSTFVVDEDGRIELAQYNVKATGHVAKLRRDLGLD